MSRTAEEWGRVAVSLPGAIPGLLRRGSPVIVLDGSGDPMVVGDMDERGRVYVPTHGCYDGECMQWEHAAGFALDLSDPTGRIHAAWWLADNNDAIERLPAFPGCTQNEFTAVLRGCAWPGRNMTDEQIDILRRVVLHVAGMEVKP